jgi:hypothetical protein
MHFFQSVAWGCRIRAPHECNKYAEQNTKLRRAFQTDAASRNDSRTAEKCDIKSAIEKRKSVPQNCGVPSVE